MYLAAQAKAIEFAAYGNYHVPTQVDLIDYIGAEVNRDAVITVVDENRDAIIDAIVYTRSGLVIRYSPGNREVEKEK